MHTWGDEDVDWQGIDAAAEYIGLGLRRWGRMDVRQYKEKWGTVRVYLGLGLFWWPQLTHPGWVRNPYPKWTWKFQARPEWVFNTLNRVVIPYHTWLYKRYYRKAVERWPHLEKEIVTYADYPKLLR